MTGGLRVAVVGAGFAGLAAADALAASGVDVIVFEARDRVGGRVWSSELGGGAVIERGAEFILPGNDTMLGYVRRFGLGLWNKGMLYGDREPRGGIGVAPGALHEALDQIGAALHDGRSGVSAAALLEGLPLDPGATRSDPGAARGVGCGDGRPGSGACARRARRALRRRVPERRRR